MVFNRVLGTLGIFLFCINIAVVVMEENDGEVRWDTCECAAFDFQADIVKPNVAPILSQIPLNVSCNEDGIKTCHQMCTDLVKIGKDRAPDVLCAVVKHSDGFRPSLYTRTCSGDWTFSGLTCEHLICCHDGLSIPCDKPSTESKPDVLKV